VRNGPPSYPVTWSRNFWPEFRTYFEKEAPELRGPFPLEAKPGVPLHNSRSHRAQELAEEDVVDAGPQTGEVRVIQRIEHVGSDLQSHVLSKREVLRQAEVNIPHSRRTSYTDARISGSNGRTRGAR
jgi:hypothetical protein